MKIKEIKTILFLLLPVIFLIVVALSFDERNRVLYEKVKVVANKPRGKTRIGWFDTSVEVRVSYRPSFLRRFQLAFTKYPQVFPIFGETYLVDEDGKRYNEFILPTGKITMDIWGGSCMWEDCMKADEKFVSLNSGSFPYSYQFPFLQQQVPDDGKRLFFHTQFEAYGTPQPEIKILVRE